MIMSISGDTNSSTIMKIKLVAIPIATHAIMITGPSVDGSGISIL